MKRLVMVGVIVLFGRVALGTMVISEWMYNGSGAGSTGEFVEFTNVGPDPVDMSGWSFDDNSQTPNTIDLSALGVVDPGESVILTDETAADFATIWGLTGVGVVGGNSANLGRSDEINLFDAADNLVDRLTYNDQVGQGPRTQNTSCNIPASDYVHTVAQSTWILAAVGDSYGSWASSRGEIGSPGIVPEPGTLAILLVGGLLARHRRG
jgi:predicted extracellular nuclease